MKVKLFFGFIGSSILSLALGVYLGISLNSFSDQIGWADALHVYRMGANDGNPEAQYWMAKYILEGKGHEPDPSQGFYWMKQSAENGYIKAQNYLKLVQLVLSKE